MNIISGFSAQNNHVRFKTCWQFGEAHGDRCRGAWSPDFGLRCTANPTMMSRGFPRFHMTAQGGKHKWAWRSIQPHKSQANLTGGTPGVKLPKDPLPLSEADEAAQENQRSSRTSTDEASESKTR